MLYEILPDPRRLLAAAKSGEAREVLQFHRPIPDPVPVGRFEPKGEVVDELAPRAAYLDWVQQACAALGDRLEVRFFDHFEDGFDAAVLDALSEIRSLAIDSLPAVRNADAVGRLPRLTALRFGPRRVDDRQVLAKLGVQRLGEFTLAGTPEPALDLAPLGEAEALRRLRLLGHGRNTRAIGRLAALQELALQPSAKEPLDFIGAMRGLESLKFVLGAAASIAAVGPLPALRDLSVREVRLLEDLGDLQRFPGLRRLQVSDQRRIGRLQVGAANAALEHLYLYSVPQLSGIEGLAALPAARSLFAYDSRLELDWTDLPPTLTHLRLLTRQMKGRDAHEAQVRAHGLDPEPHPEATFFYK